MTRPDLPWRSGLRALALLTAMAAGSAQAAVYTSVWDPPFGSPFNNLGWRGTADFFVPENCRPEGTAIVVNATSCAGQAAVTAAQVVLYDTNAETQPLAVLNFSPASLVIDSLSYVEGALTQLSTSLSNAVLPTASLADFGVAAGTSFRLQFTLTGPRLGYQVCAATQDNCSVSGFNDGINFPPNFRITQLSTQLPEPATAWLGGLALAALLATRRRATARR